MARNLVAETTLLERSNASHGEAGRPGLQLLLMSPDLFCAVPLPDQGELTIGRSEETDIQIHDPLASRRHALLRLGGPAVMLEDLSSSNGTKVRDTVIPAHVPVAIRPGEAVFIGGTCLMLQESTARLEHGRVWSHPHFETRVEEEIARARIAGSSFVIAEIKVERPAAWTQILPILVREINPPHLIGTYGPSEYEVLFSGGSVQAAQEILERLVAALVQAGHNARFGLAKFPRDGRTADALVASAHASVLGRVESKDGFLPPIDSAMKKLHEIAARAAASNINVLLLGETGVGKDVLAQTVHKLSPRRDKPILCLNCAGLSESLLESELFGYEKGAFTGATQGKAGLLETADGGSVFLDEVGELPLVVQAKLLRFIEQRQFTRVGGLKPLTLNMRFISATNRDLESESSTFRRDLFFRLNGISLNIPPLRERPSEIAPLARTFVAEACRQLDRHPELIISEEAMAWLEAYDWPGNIRELRNVIERAAVLASGTELALEHLPTEKMRKKSPPLSEEPSIHPPPALPSNPPLPEGVELSRKQQLERQRIIEALAACAGNQSRAAQLLGIARRTLVTKLDTYHIPRPQK